jgi:hypothetical protein
MQPGFMRGVPVEKLAGSAIILVVGRHDKRFL